MTQDELATLDNTKISPRERKFSHLMLWFEDLIKVPVFRCQHCGECLLSSTAFTCSQRCPKRIRNGPCGGTGKDGSCEVYPDRKCIWFLIHRRTKRMNRLAALYDIKKIHNWSLEGTSAWLNVFKRRIDPPIIFLTREQKRKKLSGQDIQR
ncbi:methylenetetrahydrofolate reductase C-terminal domain-containing protein [bacterium]|nr:methylenetetrahydrofolate reductase C-terminal domain-containing protein [bacterium]